jgi:transposase
MRAMCDLMRRRNYFVRKRAQRVAHIQNTTSQYNLRPLGKLARPHHRRDRDIAGHFHDPVVQLMIKADLVTIDFFDPLIKELDKQILALAGQGDPISLHLLRSVHDIGHVFGQIQCYFLYFFALFAR